MLARLASRCALSLIAATTFSSLAPAAADEDFAVASYLRAHCQDCHTGDTAEHGVRLDNLSAQADDPAEFRRWERVLKQLRRGAMPPKDAPQPPRAATTATVAQITTLLDAASARRRAEGRAVLRRLNRVEYENTVRDLFAVDVRVKEILPEDTIAHGFDNVGAALNISPVLMERYLEAADVVISAASVAVPPSQVPPGRGQPIAVRKQESYSLLESLPSWFLPSVYPRDKSVVLFQPDSSATALDKFRAPAPGLYRFKIHASAYQSKTSLPMLVLAGSFRSVSGSAEQLGYFDVPPGKPSTIEVEARLHARGETIKIVPADLLKVYLKRDIMPTYLGPGLEIHSVEVDGPLPEVSPPAAFQQLFGGVDPTKGTLADAEVILRRLLPRAFRRPTTDEDLAPLLKLVEAELAAGRTFETALRGGIKGVLCSPHFLYFRERPGPLDDHALATRLSYFFWSTAPDAELTRLADAGKLHEPAVLRTQAERLLADPRAAAFTANFTGQWLSLRDIDSNMPDAQLYPEYDELLKWSMVEETRAFFNELLHHDLSLLNFLDSDFAMINARLARHYGIDGVEGVAIRKVPLRPEHHRGGILTHASVLKVTANGTTTSPIVRGVWVLDRILGEPPSPPPPNVPAVEPDIRGATTIREQLTKHRATAACASCHKYIDPPGYALENYDVIGGRRDHYRALGVKPVAVTGLEPSVLKILQKPRWGHGLAVDAGDTLADGRSFADVEEFKQLLLAYPERFAENLARKLVIYATGQGVEYGDEAEIARLVEQSKRSGYGLKSLVLEITSSELFRNK
ncbi:MAG: hypothetical protein C0483_02710 [Pirellula sp.]|nr:hypothetical protein [Pirellula sp.]